MINHGLALFKPGESDLGTAMRLWIVNQHSWKHECIAIDDRINDAQLVQDPIYSPLCTNGPNNLATLKRAHAKVLGCDPSLQISKWPSTSNVRNFVFRKQCASCAKLGHHSILFDLPWIKKCPIHEEPLSKHCPKCNRYWPSISQLSTRSCDLCGARTSLDQLLIEDAFDAQPYAKKTPELISFFHVDAHLYQPCRKYFVDFPAAREDTLSLVNALPSLLSYCSNDHSLFGRLEKLGVQLSRCTAKSFELVSINKDKPLKIDTKLMEHCRHRIFKLARRQLVREARHQIGACEIDTLYGHFKCLYCETIKQLDEGFRKSLTTREDRIVLHYAPPYTRAISVTDPGIVTSLHDLETESFFEVPQDIQSVIYSIELWQCVVRMFSQIEFFLNTGPIVGSNPARLSELQKNYLEHRKHHFTPFYFVKNEKRCRVHFPNAFAMRELSSAFHEVEPFTEESCA